MQRHLRSFFTLSGQQRSSSAIFFLGSYQMPSAWIQHVQKTAAKQKISYTAAMKVASKTWKGGKATKAAPKTAKAAKASAAEKS